MPEISIHAPQWGATWLRRLPLAVTYFNPRTPVGCDGGLGVQFAQMVISIHAPQWGATAALASKSVSAAYFNPRTPVGCDWATGSPSHPTGDFNPRTPVGCDLIAELGAVHVIISIHAPQWGATSSWT